MILKYLFYSTIVTVIDFFVVWALTNFLNVNLIYANTIAVILGFIIHYILASKSVFNTGYGIKGFTVYILTFILGLICADVLIYVSYEYLFYFMENNIKLLLSKGVSIVGPFFIMYFIRKYAYKILNKKVV
ncbi:GtrA family protein [Clostridium guangxiense]|uniref:GtrA family protein n=1 Tax=Clostridium guangxiense TaxID=1662055 RepID=UPI001E4FEDD4|nr:GtrA family protein [Clostridium guangxiense]MCD2346181.1 GtrA family protein [Clostridium guangxiense]